MILNIPRASYVVFDLDDTIYSEYDYLCSAYKEISEILKLQIKQDLFQEMLELWNNGKDVFESIISRYDLRMSKALLLNIYRYHFPKISPFDGVLELIQSLEDANIKIGLLTDGRSVTQRNKVKALGLNGLFERVVISEEVGSEKPFRGNYEKFIKDKSLLEYCYISDNPNKDFISPNLLGWKSVGVTGGKNRIHKYNYDAPVTHKPKFEIEHTGLLKINIID